VTITNLQGVGGTVEVTASSVFEAVAKALTAIGHKPMLRPDGLKPVKVRVLDACGLRGAVAGISRNG
jgi:hypothetical protein